MLSRTICRVSRCTLQTRPRYFSNVIPFKLADIGEGIAEVEMMKWFVNAGDKVKAFDRLCEVQSDKATVEITSRYDGVVLTLHHKEGDIVKVGSALVDIQTGDPTAAVVSKTTTTPTTTTTTGTAATSSPSSSLNQLNLDIANPDHKVLTTPAVRKIAKERGIDLSRVSGTGPKGRIVKEDVLNLNQSTKSPITTAEKNVHPGGGNDAKVAVANTFESARKSTQDRVVPIRGVQRLMVANMNAALQVQHLTLCEEVHFDKVIALRKELNKLLAKKGTKDGQVTKMSFMPILIKATSLALLKYPMLNSTVNADVTEVVYHSNHNIGIAIDSPKGLIVPVIERVQEKSILEIAHDIAVLQEAANTGSLKENQLKGGTFSLSNIGSIGGTYAVPVLVVPQVAIGAFGRLQIQPRYLNSDISLASESEIFSGKATVEPASLINVSWSADHRVIDGATVGKFSNLWKSYIESPNTMFTDLH